MKRFLPVIMMVAAAVTTLSCGDPAADAVRFGKDLQTALQQGAGVETLCPFAGEGDSLAFAFDPAAVRARKVREGIEADYGSGVRILLQKDAGGSLTAKASYGLIAYPERVLSAARPVGRFAEGLSDADNALRLRDRGFDAYFKWFLVPQAAPLKIAATVRSKVPATPTDKGSGYWTVENIASKAVPGDSYRIEYTTQFISGSLEKTGRGSCPGKDVAPGESVQLEYRFTGQEELYNPHIAYTLSQAELFEKYFTPSGEEYAGFEKTYGAVCTVAPEGVPGEKKAVSGRLGAYPVEGSFTPERGGRFVLSFALRSGASARTLEGQWRSEGRMTALETDEKGGMTAFYSGAFADGALKGTCLDDKGRKLDFSLQLGNVNQ